MSLTRRTALHLTALHRPLLLSFTAFGLLSCKAPAPQNATKAQAFTPCTVVTKVDGEGCAVVDKDVLIAGSDDQFVVTFTVGPTGIAVGGGVALGLHHGADWPLQITAPGAKNYLKVESSAGDNVVLENAYPDRYNMFPDDPPSDFSNVIFNNIFKAKVVGEPLTAGTRLTFTYGASPLKLKIQEYQDPKHEIRVTTDLDGDGLYGRIEDGLYIYIRPDSAAQLSASAQAQVETGKPLSVLFRAEDANFNLDDQYSGKITVRDEQGEIVGKNIRIKDGLARTDITLTTSGPHRLRLEDSTGTLVGRSNPIIAFDTLPERKLYWGDIHGHTGTSDGLGRSIDKYFAYGRDVGGLDVIALTDHGHFDWKGTTAAVQKYYDPGKYVTILAQEAGASADHMNIYLRRDNMQHIAQWQYDYTKFQDFLFDQYNKDGQEQAMTGPHHFAFDRNGRSDPLYPFGYWDERIARFVEVYSSHGTAEFYGNPRPLAGENKDLRKYMQYGLAQGLRFGVIGASDNHDSHPGRSVWGRQKSGLAGFWATDLTREAVWKSMWDYNVYATSFDRIYVDMTLNGEIMGSDIEVDGPVKIKAYIVGKEDALKVELVKNNENVATQSTKDGVIEFEYSDDPKAGEHFYYLRVTQENGERAWSTPVWVKRK